MRAYWAIIPTLLMLAACGDPLAGIERVSDGVTLPDTDAATALPTPEELDRDTPILAGLFRRRDAAPTDQTEDAPPDDLIAAIPPLSDDAGADGEVGEPAAQEQDQTATDTAAAQPDPGPKGVFGWLRRAAVGTQNSAAAEQIATGTDAGEDLDFDDGTTPPDDPAIDDVKIASLSPDAIPADTPPDFVAPEKRRGLFGRDAPAPSAGMALRDVAAGTALPFGEVGRACDARPSAVGKLVERAAPRGAGYALYDTAPDSAGPRTFYITGFSDNCARQFTASLAIFGAPAFHEQLRYGLAAKEYPYSTTDRAYEKVKQKVCNVGRRVPCGTRISRLEKTTVFISVYEHFGENARWADMLLHDGALLAAAVKTP